MRGKNSIIPSELIIAVIGGKLGMSTLKVEMSVLCYAISIVCYLTFNNIGNMMSLPDGLI